MKKLFVFVGLATAGSATLPVYAQDLGPMQTTKIWSASASLRGFYDDNYTTSPNGDKQGSAGFEVSPSVQFNVPLQQTEIGLKYTYGLYYYQARATDGNDPIDQSHQAELWLDHAFTERVQGTVKDTFIIGFEPTLNTSNGNQPASTFRVDGNYLANNANISLTTDWTREFSTVLNYNNAVYYYQNDNGTPSDPSLAGQLNRLAQSVGMDFQWAVDPETVALIGYQFQWTLYTAGEPIAQVITNPGPPPTGPTYFSDDRNNQSHFLYLGFQHSFLPNLNVSAKVGAQDTIYVNNAITPNQLSPYVSASSSYTYAPGSYVQLGFQHIQIASDNTTPGSDGSISQNSQSSVFSASINHQITAKLTGSVVGSIQKHPLLSGSL